MRCTICAFTLSLTAFAFTACTHGDSRAAAPKVSATASADRLLPAGADLGMWVWHREEVIDPAARTQLLDFCRKYGVTRLLVQVRFDISDDDVSLANPDAWRALLREASRTGVAIEALDGADTMGFAENRAATLARLNAVLAFHRKQPVSARFAGLHYDIEPYTSGRWKDGDVPAVMQELLETFSVMRSAVRAVDPKLTISHDIPSWFDSQEKYILEFAGVRKPLSEHIQDLSDYIGIMSYRTHVTGHNSASAISAGELAYGTKIGRPVYLSLETVPLKDTPQITFHGRPREEYVAAIRGLHAHLADTPSFGGILLHQYRTIRPILENEPPAER